MIRARNIFDAKPPFLILFGNGEWKVAQALTEHPDGVAYKEPFAKVSQPDAPSGVVAGSPWHVGDNVWEMDFNTQIMTLDHPNYHRHPAWRLWLQWLSYQDEHDSQLTH